MPSRISSRSECHPTAPLFDVPICLFICLYALIYYYYTLFVFFLFWSFSSTANLLSLPHFRTLPTTPSYNITPYAPTPLSDTPISDMTKEDWQLVIKLKTVFSIT